MFRRHPILTFVTLGYLALVGIVTLSPMPDTGRDSIIHRLVAIFDRVPLTQWLDYFVLEFIANVAMFLPLGLFLVLLLGRRLWWLCILFSIGLTLVLEFAQQFLPSRVSDPRDLVANSIGATLGVLIALAVTAAKARRIRNERARPRTRPTPVTGRS